MHNVSRHVRDHALKKPNHPATILPSGKFITFEELEDRICRFAGHFQKAGIRSGMRVAVFVPPGFDFVPTIMALFRLGAIAVCIDPGMHMRSMKKCFKDSKLDAVVGANLVLSVLRLFVRLPSLSVSPKRSLPYSDIFKAKPHSPAAILFTSGSTGIAKGVEYSHGAFDGQREILQKTYSIEPNEVDLVAFPLFALFSCSWGVTAVIPPFSPRRPARASGKKIARVITHFKVTHTAGSPAIWKNLASYCKKTGTKLPTLKRILTAGAQVPESLVSACREFLDNSARVYTPYGATEALPLTNIDDKELVQLYSATRRGAGTCVGKPIGNVDIAIISPTDQVISHWDDGLRLPSGRLGEIVVRGPLVTKSYFEKPNANALSKIGEWHRMGDIGYFDEAGRLWFCGRKDHRIVFENDWLTPDTWEAVFDNHPKVKRSAVVGVSEPILIIERLFPSKKLAHELLQIAKALPHGEKLKRVLFRRRLPVDTRHNIKIDRLLLRELI